MAKDLLFKKGLDPSGNLTASLNEKYLREAGDTIHDSFMEPSIMSN